MRNETRRRFRSPVAWALALVFGVPALAEAQQSGLFPLRPIKRERVPRAMEDPIYQLNREQYFGYFPTCWRPFPRGWGCPSPEAPNVEEEFRREPLQKPTGLAPLPGEEGGNLPGMGPGEPGGGLEGMPGGTAPGPGNLPALPPGRSPFEIDEGKPSTPPGGAQPGGAQPGTAPPRDRTTPSPFDPGTLEPTKPSAGASSLPGPVESPAVSTTSGAGGDSPPTAQPPGLSEPLLALPDPSATPSAAPAGGSPTIPTTTPPGSGPLANGTTGSILAPIYQAQPAQAPTRRGPISSFFNSLLRR